MSGTILLADDEPSIRRVLTMALEHSGYSVYTVPDGAMMRKLLEQTQDFDLIVADMCMPDWAGMPDLLKIKETYGIPVLAISGHCRESYDGYDIPFLHKPFDLVDLLTMVGTLIAQETVQ